MRTTTLHTRLFGVLLLSASLAACDTTPDSAEAPRPSDPMITARIQSSYFADAAVKGLDIDVSTSAGVVTLEGDVDSDTEKARAVELARDAEGVVSVEDHLVVRPITTADAEPAESTDINEARVATEIQAKYFLDPDVKGRNIDVKVAPDGTVTLVGVVDTTDAQMQAVALARQTDGVRDVQDRLVMASELPGAEETLADADASVSDSWITTKIQARYFIDSDVKGRNIDVTTEGGEVSLSGTVESEAEKREAVALAGDIDGVTRVRDELQVVPSAEAETTSARAEADDETPMSDAWVTTKIQAQYFADPGVSSLAVDVTTEDGVVTLTGTVDSSTEKTLAEQIASSTDGVRRVENRLTIRA